MKRTGSIFPRIAAVGSMLLLASCATEPTVVTQTTTTMETTAVTRGRHVVSPATTVIYPSEVRSVSYPSTVAYPSTVRTVAYRY